jgi:hypothetical protein
MLGRELVSNVGDYQSAIQLVVGANLAFFTFPELRQPNLPKLEVEMKRWASLLQAVPASDPTYSLILAGALQVGGIRQSLETNLGGLRVFCLGISALYAGLLLWTCHAASQPTDGWFLETASVLGVLPAGIVGYLNLSASRKLREAGVERMRFARDFMLGTLK